MQNPILIDFAQPRHFITSQGFRVLVMGWFARSMKSSIEELTRKTEDLAFMYAWGWGGIRDTLFFSIFFFHIISILLAHLFLSNQLFLSALFLFDSALNTRWL